MSSMASHTSAFSVSYIHNCKIRASHPSVSLPQSLNDRRPSYNSLVFQAARLLGPPAKFEASKLKVSFMEDEVSTRTPTRVVPRTYTLSHCDFTANLTLTISNLIQRDQLKGWYSKDDVVAEWKNVNVEVFLNVHCYVSGPNSISAMTAEFRYLIFSKELPLVSLITGFIVGAMDESSCEPFNWNWRIIVGALDELFLQQQQYP